MEQNLNSILQSLTTNPGGLGRLQRGAAIGAIADTDAFMEIFQQMMEGLSEGLQMQEPSMLLSGQAPEQEVASSNNQQLKGPKAELPMQELVAALLLLSPTSNMSLELVDVDPDELEALLGVSSVQGTDSTVALQKQALHPEEQLSTQQNINEVFTGNGQQVSSSIPQVSGDSITEPGALAAENMPSAMDESLLASLTEPAERSKVGIPLAASRPDQIQASVEQAQVSSPVQNRTVEAPHKQTIQEKSTETLPDGKALPEAGNLHIERPVVPAKEGQQMLYQGQSNFKSAIEEARKQLSGQKPGNDQPIELPNTAEVIRPIFTRPTLVGTDSIETTQFTDEPKLADQLTNGIKQNVDLGKREFTLKLRPEALGEITVKLVEKEGKTTLTILTANAQTAKLINNDLNALREAVRPMAVEVHEAVSQSSESSQAQMQQFSMSSGQQFSDQHQQAFHSNQSVSRHMAEDLDLVEPDVLEQVLETDGLDTYI